MIIKYPGTVYPRTSYITAYGSKFHLDKHCYGLRASARVVKVTACHVCVNLPGASDPFTNFDNAHHDLVV